MLAQKLILNYYTKIIAQFSQIVASIVVARIAGPSVLGTVAFGYAYAAMFNFVSALGLGSSHIKLVSEGKDLGKCISTFSLLKGSTGQVTNIIQDYKDNKFKVLLLNAKYFGSGLNLQMTSDIILYHRMDEELEKQIIGRGQRLGREGTLRVHYLCHKNEL